MAVTTNISINTNTFVLINGVDVRSSLPDKAKISLNFDNGANTDIVRVYGGRNIVRVNEKENTLFELNVPFVVGTPGYVLIKKIIRSTSPGNVFSFELKTPLLDVKSNVAVAQETGISYEVRGEGVSEESIKIKLSNPDLVEREFVTL